MTQESTNCPTCGEPLAVKGLSFFMINVIVDKHCKASPKCNVRVELTTEDKRVVIEQVPDGDRERGDDARDKQE